MVYGLGFRLHGPGFSGLTMRLVYGKESDSTAMMMQPSEATRQTCRCLGAYIHDLAIQGSVKGIRDLGSQTRCWRFGIGIWG